MECGTEVVISNAIRELFESITVTAEENAKEKVKRNLQKILNKSAKK